MKVKAHSHSILLIPCASSKQIINCAQRSKAYIKCDKRYNRKNRINKQNGENQHQRHDDFTKAKFLKIHFLKARIADIAYH